MLVSFSVLANNNNNKVHQVRYQIGLAGEWLVGWML